MFRKLCLVLVGAALVVPVSAGAAGEVVDRDEFSTTTRLSDGTLKTSVSSQPLNFKEGAAWKPVDTALEPGPSGSVKAAAVDGDLTIPSALSQPVKLAHDGRQVTVRLKGSSGGRDGVQDAAAEFEDALSGVDITYVATPQGVKETLALAGFSSPKVFDYDVRAGAGWSAGVDSRGEVVLRDGKGVVRYRIAAAVGAGHGDRAGAVGKRRGPKVGLGDARETSLGVVGEGAQRAFGAAVERCPVAAGLVKAVDL